MAIKRASGYCQNFAKAQTHPLLGAEVILSKPVLEGMWYLLVHRLIPYGELKSF